LFVNAREGDDFGAAGLDITPLLEMKYLQLVSIPYTQVSDLKPLVKLKNLEKLEISNTQISDLMH